MNEKIRLAALPKIQQNKLNAEKEYRQKMQPLFGDAEYVSADKERTAVAIELARAEAYGEKEKQTRLREKFNFLDEKCKKIEKNLSISCEKPNYCCEKCKDVGYVNGQMCECLKREISKILLKESGFGELEDFEKSIVTAGDIEPVYKLMQKWCKGRLEKNLVLLAGQPGVGKTHLSRCIASEFISQGKVVKLTTAFNMLLKYREFTKTLNQEILEDFLSADVLLIDDLGTEPAYGQTAEECVYLIINERKMRKLPTVITTNLTMDDLKNRYNERVIARIADRKTSINIYIEGSDRRLKK